MLRLLLALAYVIVSWILLAVVIIFTGTGVALGLATYYVWLLTVTDAATAKYLWLFALGVAGCAALLCAARVAHLMGLSGPMPKPAPVPRPSPPRSGPISSGAPFGPDGHLWEKDRPSPEEIARRGGAHAR